MSGIGVRSSQEMDWGSTGRRMQKSTHNASCMLPACLRCLHSITSIHTRSSTWQLVSLRLGGGSPTCPLYVCPVSLARALVDWFSSAEYGELQLVPEAHEGIVN